MLLMNTSAGEASNARLDYFPISEPIREAISRFPFNNSHEKKLIRCNLTSDFAVLGSQALLVHVFFNLLKNGLFYVQGKPNGELTIATETSPNHVVTVTDTGPGIPDAIRSHVFDRFFSTGDSHQGAGIGLSFCKMVMESIGGEIHCESREGEYTTFRLVFPPVESNSAAEFDP